MAISPVQSAAGLAYGSSASGRTISLTGVGAGNCLVIGVAGYSFAGSTVVDTTSGHGSLAFTAGPRASSSGGWSEIWYQLSAYGGDTTVTVTPTGAAYLTLFLAEFSGVATSSQPRGTATGTLGSTPAATLSTGAFSSTTVSGDLLVSVLSLTVSSGTLTWGGSETTAGNQMNAGSNESGAMGYVIGSGSDAARQASWTTSSSFAALAALALKAATASGGPFPWYFQSGQSGGLWDGGF